MTEEQHYFLMYRPGGQSFGKHFYHSFTETNFGLFRELMTGGEARHDELR